MAAKNQRGRTGTSASSSRKTGTKRTSGRKGSSGRKNTKKNQSVVGGFQTEIIILIVLAAAMILMISALGFGGAVGGAIRVACFGVMGLMAYVFPVFLFVGTVFLVSNRQNSLAYKKMLAALVFFVFLCGFVQLVTEGYMQSTTLADYYRLCAEYHTGGGVIGGAICISTTSAFGVAGGYIIIVAVLLISLILITQRSFFGFVFKIWDAILGVVRGGHERYMEGQPERDLKKEIREQERRQRREERQAERIRKLEESLAEGKENGGAEAVSVLANGSADGAVNGSVDEATDGSTKKGSAKKGFAGGADGSGADSGSSSGSASEKNNGSGNAKAPRRPAFLEGTWLDRPGKGKKAEAAEALDSPVSPDSSEEELPDDLTIRSTETGQGQMEFHIQRSGSETYDGDVAEASEEFDSDGDDTIGDMDFDESAEDFGNLAAGRGIAGQPGTIAEPAVDANANAGGGADSGTASGKTGSGAASGKAGSGAANDEAGAQHHKNPKSSKDEIESGIRNIQHEITQQAAVKKEYHYPPLKLLKRGDGKSSGDSDAYLRKTAQKLQDTLHNFGVNVTVTNVSCGPTVTRYELQPEQGVKVSRIVGLADDIKLNLATPDIRIEAPIPGKAAVGIEVPNKENHAVMLREILQSKEFQEAKSKLAFAVGKDIGGKPVVTDIAKMPHLLIAGATGSGKSVCINTLIVSILYKASPDDVKLIMIDPKVVELSVYNGIPHLFIPVVTDPKKAAGALNWAVTEMMNRYNTFAEYNVRNLKEYNRKVEGMRIPEGEERPEKMAQIVIIVDELADLMMVAPGEVEDAICRLAQLARAAGIHLIIATQRPSVNVITGLIKANMPSRIAFSVSSGVDSRTILDMNGAEKLLGKGDMLFYPQGYQKPARVQGAFVSDEEVSSIVAFLADKNPGAEYNAQIEQQVNTVSLSGSAGGEERDTYFEEAGKLIIDKDKASIGMLQRMFKIGFNRAARIMDQLCDAGVVGPEEGTKPRKVLMSMEEFQNYLEEYL